MKLRRTALYLMIITSVFLFVPGCDDGPGLKEEDMTEFNKITWLKGIWEGRQGDAKLYESWRSKNYRILEGLSFTSVGGERVYIQTMRIEQSNNKIILVIKAGEGEEETQLELKEASENKIIFSNPENKFPEQVTYRREKNRMIVEVSGTFGSEEKSQEFVYRKTDQT